MNKKLSSSHRDSEQELFGAMLNMLKYIDEQQSEGEILFGTDYFERVWEGMIDRAFGIEDKSKYFPKTRWIIRDDTDKEKRPLFPDSIMIYKGKHYVLDAKYYKYGRTGRIGDLPGSADINKQMYRKNHLLTAIEKNFFS